MGWKHLRAIFVIALAAILGGTGGGLLSAADGYSAMFWAGLGMVITAVAVLVSGIVWTVRMEKRERCKRRRPIVIASKNGIRTEWRDADDA